MMFANLSLIKPVQAVQIPGDAGSGSKITNTALDFNLRGLSGSVFLGNFLSVVVSLFLIVGALAFFFMLLLGGFQWLTSGGDKAGVEAARGRITSGFIGLIIIFAAWAIILLIENFLGVKIVGGPIRIPTITNP